MLNAAFSGDAYHFNDSILRAYDVRGIVGESLFASDAYALGRAFATKVAEISGNAAPKITVGRDGRMSSPELADAVKQGLRDGGAHVTDVGRGPTPMLYFSVYHLSADAGIMITGSHNPPTHNGFKMTLKKRPFFGDDIQALGAIAASGAYATGDGTIETVSIMDDYIERMLRDFKTQGAKPLTVVWDAGNGAAGEAMKKLTQKLPGKHILLFEDIDGQFPNHHPDPTMPENLVDLQNAVAEHNADFGVAFDGDGDRIGAVDSTGRIIWGDQLLMFYSREILAEKPGATIIADVKASQGLFDDIAKHGGKPLMWKTGHSLIKAKMGEVNASMAGEMSGHIFFADKYYGFDDGLYAAVRLLNLAAHSAESITEMRGNIPEAFNTPEIRIDCPEERKFAVVEEIRARLKNSSYEVNEVDGVRVKVGSGWWLARASNTQAAIIVRCEAADAKALQQLCVMVEEQLKLSHIEQKVG